MYVGAYRIASNAPIGLHVVMCVVVMRSTVSPVGDSLEFWNSDGYLTLPVGGP